MFRKKGWTIFLLEEVVMILPSLQKENSSFVFANENFSLKSKGKGKG